MLAAMRLTCAGLLVLPELAVASCRAAMCFSGHARSFIHPHVRKHLKKRLIEPLECETVDIYFYLELEEPRELTLRQAWDNFTQQPAITAEEVRAAALEFNPVTIVLHHGDIKPLPHSCGEKGAPAKSFSQLYKMAACFGLIESAENVDTRPPPKHYDWIVRARPDLAWVGSVIPLESFRRDRVFLPAHFWPVGDMFALVPRQLARTYFRAIDSFYTCRTMCREMPPWYLPQVRAKNEDDLTTLQLHAGRCTRESSL